MRVGVTACTTLFNNICTRARARCVLILPLDKRQIDDTRVQVMKLTSLQLWKLIINFKQLLAKI